MEFVKAFKGIRPTSISPASITHDAISFAKRITASKPKENILTMLNDNVLCQDNSPCFYIYKKINPVLTTLGIIALTSIQAVNNTIIQHEATTSSKEQLYKDSFVKNRIQINPVLLLHKHQETLDISLQQIIQRVPDITIHVDRDTHQIWIINDQKCVNSLASQLNAIENFYVADGHHRISALKEFYKNFTTKEEYFLAALVSDQYVTLKSYNRVIHNLKLKDDPLNKLHDKFHVSTTKQPKNNPQKGTFVLYSNRIWLELKLKSESTILNTHSLFDPIIANQFIINEVYGICYEKTDAHIRYLPETYDIDYVKSYVDEHTANAALFIPQISISDFYSVIDKKITLPHNTTWFEPKFIDGLISCVF